MKRLMILATATLAIAQAHAADLPVRAAPVIVPPPAFSWTGAYIGGWGGYAFGDATTYDLNAYNSSSFIYHHRPDGGAGGGTLGYNYQIQNFVFGLEGTAGYVGLSSQQQYGPFIGVPTRVGDSISKARGGFLGTVTGRAGIAINTVLLYGKGGYAWTDFEASYVDPNPTGTTLVAGTKTKFRDGFTVGAGVEYAFLPNWTVKAEYNYVDLGNRTHVATTNVGTNFRFEHKLTANIASVGVNYKFNLF